MRVGVVFPQTEIGSDPAAIRDFVQAAEGLGCTHVTAYDHVVNANPDSPRRPGWRGKYTFKDAFHEPLVLFGYLAGITQSIEMFTGVLLLPQRQTALVAKQAAEVDVLSGGRLRLGIGLGRHEFDYDALGADFHDRGRRSAEQISVLRALWTEPLVTFESEWHGIVDAGINPLPVQRPIPIWLGGHAEPVLRRIAELGDGWVPLFAPDDKGRAEVDKLRGYVSQAGRRPDSVGIETYINLADRSFDDCVGRTAAWQELGATHVSLDTMNMGYASVDAHIDAVRRFKEAVAGL